MWLLRWSFMFYAKAHNLLKHIRVFKLACLIALSRITPKKASKIGRLAGVETEHHIGTEWGLPTNITILLERYYRGSPLVKYVVCTPWFSSHRIYFC